MSVTDVVSLYVLDKGDCIGTVPSIYRNRHYTVYRSLHYAPLQGIGAGTASSLPSLVLRSMLKQRRILMRMH